jgi:DNA-binding beta-propeller fold protein YncE
VFVSDWGNHRVQVFSSAGVFLRKIGRADATEGSQPGEFNGPCQLAVSGRGELFVADCWNDRVQVLSLEGRSGGLGSGHGQMRGPIGVVVSATGEVFVGDCGNSRVQVFSSV